MIVEKRPIPDCLTVTELPNEEFRQCWDGLIGAEELKNRISTHVRVCLSPTYFFSWLQQYNSTPRARNFRRRIMLVGPPGTGKTLMAKGASDLYARQEGTKGYFVELGSVRGKFVGESSKNIERAFDYVEYLSEDSFTIFFMDEFDSVGVSRNNEQMHDDVRAMVNTLIRRVNKLDSLRIFIIAASNLERHVDYATKRRFDFILYFNRPTLDQRIDLLTNLLQGWNFSTGEISTLGKKTEKYTQDDITRIVNLAEETACSENKQLSFFHIMRAMSEIKPTEGYS